MLEPKTDPLATRGTKAYPMLPAAPVTQTVKVLEEDDLVPDDELQLLLLDELQQVHFNK